MRDCFAREINAQQKTKSGSAKSDRKQYIFFNQLSFLRQGIEKRKTTSSLDDIISQANDTIVNDLPQISAETDLPNVSNPVNNLNFNVPDPQNVSEPTGMVCVRPPTVTSRKRKKRTDR